MNERLTLGGEFPPVSEEAWLSQVEKVLKGADFRKTLVTTTYDDLDINPLYSTLAQHPANPGSFPYTRAVSANGLSQQGWQVAQAYTHPDIAKGRKLLLEDLQKGVTRLRLRMSSASRRGETTLRAAQPAEAGLECYSVDDLDRLLEGVQLELVPTDVQAGAAYLEFALALQALWQKRGLANDQVEGGFNADPAAALAEFGTLPNDSEHMLARLATLAADTASQYPKVRAVGVDTAVYHNAGATHAQEIAIALATGVSYLRAMTATGMDINAACAQIRFFITTDTEYFQCISKLRSLRQLWAQVCQHSGADPEAAAIDLHATASMRMLSQRDPWVNMLRATIASNAAALGGAESIETACFDQALGQPSSLGRRISRNTQLLLLEESSMHRVVDPAGGSWFIEAHTQALSEKAWAIFQQLEKYGGIFEALTSGKVQGAIAAIREQRMAKIGARKQPLTGVSEFANLGEELPAVERVDTDAVFRDVSARNPGQDITATLVPTDLAPIKDLLSQQALTHQISAALAGTATTCDALPDVRLGSEFEALRDASDRQLAASGKRPTVFVITPGKPAQFNARLGFTRNFFAAGGIDVEAAEPDLTPEQAAEAWKASGYTIAVLCSADPVYADSGSDFVQALRNAGADQVYVTGNALQDETDLQIHLGSNTLDVLRTLHTRLEVN